MAENSKRCGRCGFENPNDGTVCATCGQAMPAVAEQSAASLPPNFVAPPTTSGKAVASLLFGFLFFFPLTALAAVVLGHLATADIRKSAGKLKGRGIAVGGLILGYLGIALVPVFLLALTVFGPRLLNSGAKANEAAAAGALREITVAANSYASTYKNGFPRTLQALAGVGTQDCDHAGLIDGELAAGTHEGYVFKYQFRSMGDSVGRRAALGCSEAGVSGFTLTAEPLVRGTDGQRSFYTDESGVIRYDDHGPATNSSPPLE
jgi:type IV pilus assembly protein PilA